MYLNHDSNTVVVDAVLTKKGREILSRGGGLNISKFALSDDEVDYGLWNPNHESGSDYYGEVIENLPLLEASVNETKTMRYKLVSLDKNQLYLSIIEFIPNQVMSSNQAPITIAPVTNTGLDDDAGYTMTADDSSVVGIEGFGVTEIKTTLVDNVSRTTDITRNTGLDSNTTSITQIGKTFKIHPKIQASGDATVNITVIGNTTGASTSFTVTVQQYVPTTELSR